MIRSHRGFKSLSHATVRSMRLVLAALALAGVSGCDDKRDAIPKIPPPPATTQAAPVASRPTTETLLYAPRKSLTLGGGRAPLLIDVPPSWSLTTVGTGTTLDGETPNSEVHIQVLMQPLPLKENAVQAMEKRVTATAATRPSEYEKIVPLRKIGGSARMMETRQILRNIAIPRGAGVIEHADRVEWTVNAYVPAGEDFNVITLDFIGLPLDLYNKDREFLERIISSLHYDAAGGAMK